MAEKPSEKAAEAGKGPKAAAVQQSRALPSWATSAGETARGMPIIDVDADAAYKAWLGELGADDEPDQYWLEVAYQCLKMDVQAAAGFGIELRIHDPKKRWAQSKHPAGKGSAAATQGREARDHYRRVRGVLPA